MQFIQECITCTREHTISCGHRVEGHESKCANFHGHNYTIHISCAATGLDTVGRVIDFSVIKSVCCAWLEEEWDHKFLMWVKDPNVQIQGVLDLPGLILVPFNPTAERMGQFLIRHFNDLLSPHNVRCTKIVVEETPKCSATVEQWVVTTLVDPR